MRVEEAEPDVKDQRSHAGSEACIVCSRRPVGDARASRIGYNLRCVNVLPVREGGEDQQWILLMLFVSNCRALASGVPRKNRTWEICHLAGPIRDVVPEDRRESSAGARHRCGSHEASLLAGRKNRVWRGMSCPAWCFGENVGF